MVILLKTVGVKCDSCLLKQVSLQQTEYHIAMQCVATGSDNRHLFAVLLI